MDQMTLSIYKLKFRFKKEPKIRTRRFKLNKETALKIMEKVIDLNE